MAVYLCHVLQATLSPGESGMITVVGTGVLKMFKIADQILKPLPLAANRRDTLSFTCQTWLPPASAAEAGGGATTGSADAKGAAAAALASSDRERQLLGTVDGEILLFEVRLRRQSAAVSAQEYCCAIIVPLAAIELQQCGDHPADQQQYDCASCRGGEQYSDVYFSVQLCSVCAMSAALLLLSITVLQCVHHATMNLQGDDTADVAGHRA